MIAEKVPNLLLNLKEHAVVSTVVLHIIGRCILSYSLHETTVPGLQGKVVNIAI